MKCYKNGNVKLKLIILSRSYLNLPLKKVYQNEQSEFTIQLDNYIWLSV